jgi:hypothetical protein
LADVGYRNALRGPDAHCTQRNGKAFPDLLFAPAKDDWRISGRRRLDSIPDRSGRFVMRIGGTSNVQDGRRCVSVDPLTEFVW